MSETLLLDGNLGREFATISAMVGIYCRDHHGSKQLCSDCSAFLEYARVRLDRCPYGQEKPTCNKCPVHCYKPEPRELARTIMRYAGPRMLLPHPILAIRHLLLERKPAPGKPPKDASNRHQRLQQAKAE
ncbi:nitrous oxide-stimulated promoter family protein [Shewanella sp. JM162201]|uniref:Nitrous oxide-stimulated promoter family protein n=1 Tax=Shewanella jiangmenensis TaxID=2837387 RepID=A0ABS5V4I5_9GAMM|nr:nitrous oxide-stimulated promoter family protein [Shewanella jiangmenensis]MBT1445371.1 nitrous oxide-stimulated promoter family protein [Shewanella jiangmenensis]